MSIAWARLEAIERAQLKTLGYYQEKRRSLNWLINGCPKCNGDMYPNEDDYEEYHTCLNCGCNKYYHGDTLPHPYDKGGWQSLR